MDAFLEVVKFFGAATFMDTYVGKEANALIHQNGSSNWNFSILSNESSVLQKFKLVLCNTVTCSSLEEPYILIHVHDVFMMYYHITVSGFYTSLRVFIVFYNWRIFTSLKNTLSLFKMQNSIALMVFVQFFCKCLFFEQVYLFIPFINFDLALIYTKLLRKVSDIHYYKL